MYISLDTLTDNNIIQNHHSYLVATGTTLLSYEMGWQLRLFDLMAASQQANDYVMACIYGEAFLHILGMNEEMPKKSTALKGGGQAELATWKQYYADLLMTGINKIGKTIDAVRHDPKYRKDGIVPVYEKEIKK